MRMGLSSLFKVCGRRWHRAGVPPKFFTKDGIKRRFRRALDEPECEVELRADVVAVVPGQREDHQGLGLDLRTGMGEPAVKLVGRFVEFGGDRSGHLEGQGCHGIFWLLGGMKSQRPAPEGRAGQERMPAREPEAGRRQTGG
ncbi:MAG: hypothetical protein HOP00_10080, partial [Nitrospira sp.]|nr:hypothetical protein [Nitrospira sp.]